MVDNRIPRTNNRQLLISSNKFMTEREGFFCSPDRGFPDLNAAVALVRGNKILVLFAEEGEGEEGRGRNLRGWK